MIFVKSEERILGGLLGVVIGDALGLPVQFSSRENLQTKPVAEMIGYGAFNLPPGSWSDDSSLTLCSAESLIEKGFNPADMGQKFVRWYKEGYWTPSGQSFDIGNTTMIAMENLIKGIEPLKAGPGNEWDNGNGSLMRILPAALYFSYESEEDRFKKIASISAITHSHPRCLLACCFYSLMAQELLRGSEPMMAYENMREQAQNIFVYSEWSGELKHFYRILNGSLPHLPKDMIKSSGYVIDTLEAALWCLLNSNDFKHTLLSAVNLGDDTDTVGAVAGGLAGIYYGFTQIPQSWVNKLIRLEDITVLANKFVEIICKNMA